MSATWTWAAVGGGHLAVGHRPKISDLARLAAAGGTHVLTLLSEREGARAIGDAVEDAGLVWLWLPLESGRPEDAGVAAVRVAIGQVRAALLEGGRVLVHCSAGIHRTGMVSAAILRRLGLEADDVRAVLREMRVVTADGVGEARLAWADRFASA